MIQRCFLLCAAVLAAFLFPAGSHGAKSPPAHPRVGLIAHDNVTAYTRASTRSPVVAVLVQQTQIEILGSRGSWDHVSIWDSVHGWVPKHDIVFRRPWESVSTYRAPEVHYHVHAHSLQVIAQNAILTAASPIYRAPGSALLSSRPAGTRLQLTGWQQDAAGKIWYRSGRSWIPGDPVQFAAPDPGLQRVGRRPVWDAVSGKGMWVTLGTVTDSAPRALVRAALDTGISHLYVESAISPLGFHGKESVGRLLDEAHRHHLTVIAWVYPYLYDLASDVALTRQVAAFSTPSGGRFDGIAADLERDVSLSSVRAFSQLVRAYLGPSYLLVGVTYPPQSFPTYPFAEVAHDYNMIAPMDYWHQTKSEYGLDYNHMRYSYSYGYRYALDSVAVIHRFSGHVPIAPIGQTFDDFGRLEMGPHAPSGSEVQGFLAGSKAGGAIGVSFFQWMTATDEEWRVIHAYRF